MASVNEALVTRLLAVSGVSNLVSTRIYASKLPQNPTMDAITFRLISGSSDQAHDGPTGLAMRRFQFDAWSDGVIEARELAEQIRLALEGYSGTIGTIQIWAILKENDNPDYYDQTTKLWRVSADYTVHHKEAMS